MKTILIYSIIILSLFISINSFSQTPNWTTIRETNINANGSSNVDIFTNGYGNHIIVEETNVFKYYRMDVNGNKNIETLIENTQVSYSSISGDANNLYLVYRLSSSYNIKIKHSVDGGLSWSSSIPQISLSSASGYIESIVSNNRLHITYAVSSLIKYKYWDGAFWSATLDVSNNETGKEPRITAHYDGTLDRVYFLWGRNILHEGRWREYNAANNQWINDPQTAFSFGSPSQIDYSSPRGVAVDANYIYSYYEYFYMNGWYPIMQSQQRRKSNNELINTSDEQSVFILPRFYSTNTSNNYSHLAYYYVDWNESPSLETGIVRNKHTGATMIADNVYAHDYGINPPGLINISSSSNDVYVIWNDNTSNNLRFIYDDQAPLAPTNFIGTVYQNHPKISWDRIEPDIQYFEIWRKLDSNPWVLYITTSNNSFVDNGIQIGELASGTVKYKVRSKDWGNHLSGYTGEVSFSYTGLNKISVGNNSESFSLSQNYPNPFNPSTVISYSIPFEGSVRVRVFNMLGEMVSELVNQTQPAGEYETIFDAGNLASGMYFYSIEVISSDETQILKEVKKMLLQK